jgi:hypothetical protein
MSQIHNPTLRVLHRWIASNLTPRAELRRVLVEDLQYLFALARRIKVNPTIHLVDYWISVRDTVSCPITFTSFITKIAIGVGALQFNTLAYLGEQWPIIGTDHFTQGHLLRVGINNWTRTMEYYMLYLGFVTEVHLPDLRLYLYTVDRLTVRHSVAGTGPTTRSRARLQEETHGGIMRQFPPGWLQFTGQHTGWGGPSHQPFGTYSHQDPYGAGSSRQHESGPSSFGPSVGPSASARYPSYKGRLVS